MKKSILFALCILSISTISCFESQKRPAMNFIDIEGKEVGFETVEQGYNSGLDKRTNYIITNKHDWGILWNRVHLTVSPRSALPQVDFTENMIIAVSQGTFGTGGYSIEIIKAIETENTLEIFVIETYPGPWCVLTQSVTQPYHIIELKKTNKKILFNVEKQIENC